jgi:tetratricopeptide (TPR) repeat protein
MERPAPTRLPSGTGAPDLRPVVGRRLAGLACLCAAAYWIPTDGLAQSKTDEVATTSKAPQTSLLDAELFYQLLVGEMQVRSGEPGVGYSLLLDAARKSNQPELFRRAVEIALLARSGDSALAATRAWSQATPDQIEPLRYELQILMALDRPGQVAPVLQALLRLTPMQVRPDLIAALPSMLARFSDKAALLAATEPVLSAATRESGTAASAWASLGRLRLAAGQPRTALEAAERAHAAAPDQAQPALLALALLERGQAQAEALVQHMLAGPESPAQQSVRLEYARLLLEQRRHLEAEEQLLTLTRQVPQEADAWLLLGLVQVQLTRYADARAALVRYLELSPQDSDIARRGRNQAHLLLAQVAEKQQQYREAQEWLDRVVEGDPALLQMRRASLLARQGRLAEARRMLREPAADTEPDLRRQWLAEAQLLRDLGQHREALQVYRGASERFPDDADLAYEWATAAEKAGQPREMERVLRDLIARQPDHAHALNALGYFLADRNERLPEAQELIKRALALQPEDPFIQDSMGWVEYRLGRFAEARRLLEQAWARRQDPEIAAHLGEVLWVSGEREAALKAWRQGLRLGQDNQTLTDTLKRFKVRP